MEFVLLPLSAAGTLAFSCGPWLGASEPTTQASADGETADTAVLVAHADGTPSTARGAGPSVRSIDKMRHTPIATADAPPPELPALPEGTTVLHVGDSFAGALGIPLNKHLKEAGVRGVLKYRTASYIVDWAHQPALDTYLSQYHPDLVLITLGANELEIEEPERRIPAIRKIVDKVGDRPCVWVGVPLWSDEHNGLMDIVRDNAAPCRFMDSAALFPNMPRAHDRIHPTMQAREDWAVRVLSWLARQRRPTERQAWELARP
jgi:hypothetical protein